MSRESRLPVHPKISDEDWYPPPRESMLSNSKISFKMNKIDQLVDLFALPGKEHHKIISNVRNKIDLDQVAPTFQRILFDRLISNFKSAGHENLVPIELKLTLTKVQQLLGEDHLVNSEVMIKGMLREDMSDYYRTISC